MGDKTIPDENILASSSPRAARSPTHARLNGYSWWKSAGIVSEWIQADIGYQTYVSAVITQGKVAEVDPSNPEWVTLFQISTFLTSSSDIAEQIFIKDDEGNVIVGYFSDHRQ